MRNLNVAIGLAFSLLAYGAVSSVQVGDPARQQGVVSFSVNDPNQCTVTVYQDAALSMKMDDTNNNLFAGSESCARPLNIVSGRQVTAVVGRRTSEKASDGKLHSRSLEVSRTYYVSITDTTDNNTSVVSFTTANIPWGDTHVEEVPYSDYGWNRWAYPDMDWTDAGVNSKWYIDPVSGVAVKRTPRQMYGSGGWDGKHVQQVYAFGGVFDISSAWTNPQNARNTSTSGPFASYAGSASAPLYLPFISDPNGSIFSWFNESGADIEDIRASLSGSAVDTGNIEDRKVLLCLATQYNPATDTCNTPEVEVTLPTTTGTVQFPSNYPAMQFAGWNVGRNLTQNDIGIPGSCYWGSVDIVNSVATMKVYPLPAWAKSGMKININGSWYTIGTITDPMHYTVAESNVNLTGGKWYFGAFGLRIRKKTTTNNQINVAAGYSVAWDSGVPQPPNGVADWCSRLTVTVDSDATGTQYANPSLYKQGRLCWNGTFLFLLADDGETRYLSRMVHTDPTGSGSAAHIPLGGFSDTNPYVLYADHLDDTSPGKAYVALYEITYNPSTCHFRAWTGNNYDIFSSQPTDCVTWINKTPHSQGKSVTDQVASSITALPLWDSSFSLQWLALVSVNGKYAVFSQGVGGANQNGPCIEAVFDLSSYTLTKVVDSMTGSLTGFRWGGCHGPLTTFPGLDYGVWYTSNLAFTGGIYMGPYMTKDVIAKSFDGTNWNSNTSISQGTLINTATSNGKCGTDPWVVGSKCVDLTNAAGQCAANPYGVTGLQCIWLKLSSDVPCNAGGSGAGNLDVVKWPCSWHSGWAAGPNYMTIQPNDYLVQGTDPSNPSKLYFGGKAEKLRVLTKSSDDQGNTVLMLQRWSTCDNPTSDFNAAVNPALPYYTHLYDGGATYPNGWNAAMVVTQGCAGSTVWTNLAAGANDWKVDNSNITAGHFTLGKSPDGTGYFEINGSDSLTGAFPAVAASHPQHSWVDADRFNGITRAIGQEVESYPSVGNWTTPTRQHRSVWHDFRHINPGAGSGPEVSVGIWPHTYTLESGQTFTYKLGKIYQDTGDHKSRPVNLFSITGAFRNISSYNTGDVIDDTKPFTYCRAYKAGECRQNSAKGDLYVVAPGAAVTMAACEVNISKFYTPCATPLWAAAGWMTQRDSQISDPVGYRFRRITMGMTGPSIQYQYTSPHMTPDGKFAFVRAGYLNGVRADPLLVRMPPPAPVDSVDRTTFVPVPVQIASGSGYVRVRFGYAENGAANQFYCTSRQEACLTDATVSPFAFEKSDTLTAKDCRSGCTINIPALSGRVVYYTVEKSNDGSTGWVSGQMQVRAVK